MEIFKILNNYFRYRPVLVKRLIILGKTQATLNTPLFRNKFLDTQR